MTDHITHVTHTTQTPWKEETTERGGTWRSIDLSGERLGARIEELAPGATSSVHHYHSLEEEHVFVMSGAATLIVGMGDTQTRETVSAGDHIRFAAGDENAHHLKNETETTCQFLVYGERNKNDVVYYPEHSVMLVKQPERALFKYEPFEMPE